MFVKKIGASKEANVNVENLGHESPENNDERSSELLSFDLETGSLSV